MSEAHVEAGARRREYARREHKLREAEKDIALALVALHEGKYAKAFLNLAVATVRISGVMTEQDFDAVIGEVTRLKAKAEAP